MHPVQLILISTVGVVVGPWLFLRAFRDWRTRRLIQNTPTSHIRSLAMGLVEIHGAIVEKSRHVAPFSGRPCAYWQVEIATRTRNGWSTVHRNSSGSPFFVRDDTGAALVYPQGAECKVNFATEETCFGISVPDCYMQYLDEHQIGFGFVWRLSNLRFRERILEEGQLVYVLGTAMPQAQAVDVSQAEEATGTDGGAVAHAASAAHAAPAVPEAHAVVRRGERGGPFYISQQTERDLALTLGLHAWAGFVGGPALTLIGIVGWLTVRQLGWIH
jgi:hypothetical protein